MCEFYHPDRVFSTFKLIEFPTSFVGLSTSMELDVEVDLTTCAYLKTMFQGKLMKFDEARELSAAHRAFTISHVDKRTLLITFKPSNECIAKARSGSQSDNRFVFDLRLIQVDGVRCCDDELHSEVGRYYISGKYEYCQITHYPQILDAGDVYINHTATKVLRIKNDSNGILATFQYEKVTGLDVFPSNFTILPNSSRRLSVSVKPNCLKIANCLHFTIRNPQNIFTDLTNIDDNFLNYDIKVKSNILCLKKTKEIAVESMHKIIEQESRYTYIDKELTTYLNRQEKAKDLLRACKAKKKLSPPKERLCTGIVRCYSQESIKPKQQTLIEPRNFCKKIIEKIDTYELFNVFILPHSTNFGKIGLNTFGEESIVIKNNTKYDITIKFLDDDCILYTEDKLNNITFKIKKFTDMRLPVFSMGSVEGIQTGTFDYSIDNKYHRKHPYKQEVDIPVLFLHEKSLKFGMVTNESFVTSVPVKMFNHFNVPVSFRWAEMHPDTPFEIIPSGGTVPRHAAKICDVIYVCTASKSKTHEVEFMSNSDESTPTSIELNVITRKLTIKFLQPVVFFKDIPLNLKTVEIVKLENSSREIALFHVVEPLIPGITIEPMSGTIRPKMVLTFVIVAKISCIMEFAFDIYVKINNKENVVLPISGNVVEPKIIIHPKNIIMSRVPSQMVTYVPVTFQNVGSIKSTVEVLDTGDDNMFDVYVALGNEKVRIFDFTVEGGQSKTVYIKVYDTFRREYEMFIPFKINGLLGPPNENSWSTELQHYIGEYEEYYENNPRVKVKTMNKDISFCRILGVITVPWIEFSVEKFEIDYLANGKNDMEFTMTNISKYYLHVTILTAKLAPHFSLDLETEENQSIINETHIKFDLESGRQAKLIVKFHPKGRGKFVSTAVLFLDKQLSIPYHNLIFTGKRETPAMVPSISRIIFPPCLIGTSIKRTFTIKFEELADLESFYCITKEEHLTIMFTNAETMKNLISTQTVVTVEIKASSDIVYTQDIIIGFFHECGSVCELEVSFCFTHCALTLHLNTLVQPENNPYPFYPSSEQSELYEYMESCSKFLEKWMFQQGFRRDLFPVIPDTFHAISNSISGTKVKGLNVSYLNFVRRIAGPLMKHIRKVMPTGIEGPFKNVKEIHDTYREVLKLLTARGSDLWGLQARFLLSNEQFIIYCENVTPKYNADIILTQELLADVNLFERLNKQSWIDFILQSYKVFIMDSCFFDCVCLSSQPRDVIQVIIDWYNEQIRLQHNNLRGRDKPLKVISNITSDLSDGIAIISAISNYCPFMKEYFSVFCEINSDDNEGEIINNACSIIEVLNQLRFFFPITCKDFIEPNFMQMLFFSIHLYVALPMFIPKDYLKFQPPLLRSSTRQVAICPSSQESLLFNFIILDNNKNSFTVEKAPPVDNSKKMYLNIKYMANFVGEEDAVLLVHGYNKTRIFDTYIIFMLHGHIGSLNPVRKCRVTGPLYRPNKVDVLVASPFQLTGSYKVSLTDIEPTIPVKFEEVNTPRFYLQRLNLIDKEIHLSGIPKESGQDVQEHKLYMQLTCLSTQVGNSWIWFRGEIGEFFIKVTSQPRWDLAIDTIQTKVDTWPMDPCSCGEACECYRTTVLMIPHRNELMLKAMRYALLEYASDVMMAIFDELIDTTTGKLVLGMLLAEGGTNMSDVNHILRSELTYRVSSRALIPRLEKVRLAHHTPAMLALPVTVPANDKAEKYTVTFTSECGMDIRTYRIFFIASITNTTSDTTSS